MQSQALKKLNLPDKPGVYFFVKTSPKPSPERRGGNSAPSTFQEKAGDEVLYVGKATSLKDRVRSYFGKDLINTRGMLLVDMVARADRVEYIETDNVLEALILEANEIKKHQPYYNTKEKDDKSFNYVCITKDNKIAIVRGKNLHKEKFSATFGPFTSGGQLREAMKIVRKLFPYIEERKGTKGKDEFYKQLKLSPADSEENKKNIKNIKLFFEGKKKKILLGLKKEMLTLAKENKFEEAGEIKRKIFALNHINDIALIKSDKLLEEQNYSPYALSARGGLGAKNFVLPSAFRVEAYDIAHMSGKNMVGVMVVVEDGEVAKSEYKKFKIKTQSNTNDTGALTEVLERRLAHSEWSMPKLIVVDGGKAQINVAQKILNKYGIKIPVVSVLKDEKHKPKNILGGKELAQKYEKEILLANFEAHRFAINYHKNMRNKNFLK